MHPAHELQTQGRFVRPPAVAGRFYPEGAERLARMVARLRAAAPGATPPPRARVRALLAPHAGYACSGGVAAAAFNALGAQPAVDTVLLLGPPHWQAVFGAGLSSAAAFATPLGEVPVDVQGVEALLASGPCFTYADEAHAPEHCLEVELPFLQQMLAPGFRIVPVLFDGMGQGRALVDALLHWSEQTPGGLLVVSSDLSHYRRADEAAALDGALLAALVAGDRLAMRHGEACGMAALLALMQVAAVQGWQAEMLAYQNSGDTCGSRARVVGYGAVAWVEAAAAPPTAAAEM